MDDDFIERYAAKCADDGTVIIAYVEDGVVRGAAELHPPDQSPDALPEIAFSVEARVRRQGVGSILFKEADRGSALEGLPLPADHHRRAEPGDAGAGQQVRRASDVPPRRIHRQHRSNAATAAGIGKTRDRNAGRRRARDDQCQPRLLEAAAANVRLGPDGLSGGHRVRHIRGRSMILRMVAAAGSQSGPGALVVAEFPDHAAFDHDRALRALFAGDHPGRRARGNARRLLHFGLTASIGSPISDAAISACAS